jgi:uncharacterized protein (UPF0333 family)
MMRLLGRRGQSTGEYAIVISLVVAAAIAMQTYVKRGLQGKIVKAVYNISEATDAKTVQYEPYYSKSDFTTVTNDYTMKEKTLDGGGFEKEVADIGTPKKSTRSGTQGTRSWTDAD